MAWERDLPSGVPTKVTLFDEAGWVIENKHSTDFESSPAPPRLCCEHPDIMSCSNIGSNACSQHNPAARTSSWYAGASGIRI